VKHSASAPLRRVLAAATIAILAAACGSSTDVRLERFSLVSVDGEPLPGPYPDPALPVDTYQVTQGQITLNPNGSFLMDLFVRCHPEQPPGSDCFISGDGRQPMVGTYSREQGYIQFGTRQYAASFANNRIQVHILIPPSEGLYPSFVLEFAR
jgi:hypothetical protein